MKLPMFAIRDVKTTFLTPTVDQTRESAIRNFTVAVNQGTSLIQAVPQDFDLYEIGVYDTEAGTIEAFATPVFVVAGSAVVRKEIKEDVSEA